jgi:hypothetical protein
VGVAIGVSGAAQRHSGAHPSGHVPDASAATQPGPLATGPFNVQQIIPTSQHCDPQQVCSAGQLSTLHSGLPQVP